VTVRGIALFAAVVAVAGCGGGKADESAVIGRQIGGTCTRSRYQVISHLTNTKETIYNCFNGGGMKCVTYQNGIATDSTALVRLLFANVLGSVKPTCLFANG